MSASVSAKNETQVLDLYGMYDDDYEDETAPAQSEEYSEAGGGETNNDEVDEEYSYDNYLNYEDEDGEGENPSTSQNSAQEDVDDSNDFGIKIVSAASIMESENDNDSEHEYGYQDQDDDNCSLGDDENYRFLIPDVEIEEVSTPESDHEEVYLPTATTFKPAKMQRQTIMPSMTNYYKTLLPVAESDASKPNILSRKLGFKSNFMPAASKMPPPPPLLRRPSVAAGQPRQSQQPPRPAPVTLSLEEILRSSKPMPRLQPKLGSSSQSKVTLYPKVGPTGKIAIERLPTVVNNKVQQKNSFQNRLTINSKNNKSGDSNADQHPLLGARISKKTVPRCSVCNKTFATYTILARHQKTHQMTFDCQMCHLSFTDQVTLDHHIRTNPKCNVSGLQCRICYRSFATNAALIAHMPMHEGMFRCRGCRKGFYDYASMEEHEATHTRYACDWCGKTFMNSGNLKAHERIHTGERPFRCADCPKAFKQLGGLQYHLKTNPSHRNAQSC